MKNKTYIFYVEDDATLAFVTKDNLEHKGYVVDHFENGNIALNNFKSGKYNLCILDVMLPSMDGFELAKQIRKVNKQIPILFLSARIADEDRIKGLKLGADDYITKPFSIEELILKIEVFVRRNKIVDEEPQSNELKCSETILEVLNQRIIVKGEERKLTEKETKLLGFFFNSPDQLIKREQILLEIWGDDGYFVGRSLDVFISKLRKYIKADEALKIENVHGTGFRLITNTEAIS